MMDPGQGSSDPSPHRPNSRSGIFWLFSSAVATQSQHFLAFVVRFRRGAAHSLWLNLLGKIEG